MSNVVRFAGRSQPLFTIAIPTFNRAALLEKCVTSALSQTYASFEVVVSDNASADATQEVLGRFQDPRLRVIRQDTNIGLIPNWNACLTDARGDYIVFVSDDDSVAPWLLQRCADLISTAPQIPIILTLSNLHSVSLDHTLPARTSQTYQTGHWDGIELLSEFLTDRITVTMCSVVMRTEVLRARGGIPPEYPHTADFAAWAPLLFLGQTGFVNEACATFSYHNGSETARLSVEQRLRDGTNMAELISRLADGHLTDSERREAIKAEARGYFARRGLIALSDFRTNGGDVPKVLEFLWRFRQDLRGVHMTSALRFAAIALCPRTIADWCRRRRPSVSERYA